MNPKTYSESPLAVQHNDVGEYPPLCPILRHLQELTRERFVRTPLLALEIFASFSCSCAWIVPDNSPSGILVPLVYRAMLFVQRAIEQHAFDASRVEHRLYERPEADVPMA